MKYFLVMLANSWSVIMPAREYFRSEYSENSTYLIGDSEKLN